MSASAETWREEFLAAIAFLTRLPVARWSPRGEAAETTTVVTLASAAWAFPLVGLVVGVIGGIVYIIALDIGLPALAAALLAILATVLVTGALHEDGLADTADGFGGGASRDDKLAIMRDSRTGAYGALALIFSVALRLTALNQIADGAQAFAALIAAHAIARGLLPVVLRALGPARNDGLGAGAGRPEQNVVVASCVIALVIALLAVGIRVGLTASLAAAVIALAMGWLARRQIGGYTGDVLGAIEQGSEVVALLAIASWAP
jgi:adenosylcobinamide-GDP ribazoletransferase